ncbi:MAG TPA: hypothetical protein VN777_10365 [Terriglobales bacterium]|nr:hypothetical protein [Terriglobales bacterium]
MFEAELEMEKRSAFLPLLLMVCLVAGIVGMVTYVVFQVRAKTPLSAQQASGIVASALEGPGPAIIHFRTGLVKPSPDEQPADSRYRLLEKAGIVKSAKEAHGAELISLTPVGEHLLATLPGSKKWRETDGTFSYQVPLAQRQLVGISDITMIGVNNATVEYTWKWIPNQMGDVFDAGGSLVKSFNIWDRQTLIDKYEADFYHGNPTKSMLAFVRTDRGWKISAQ